ncbi:hypothetical protein A2U01_0021360, partial [Trifolium medium]|nr:hypothetical protein [Trifolium medium]
SVTTSREPSGMSYDAEAKRVTLEAACVDLVSATLWRVAISARWCQCWRLVLFPVFLLISARRAWVDSATHSLELLRVVLFLVPARHAGWCCATHKA